MLLLLLLLRLLLLLHSCPLMAALRGHRGTECGSCKSTCMLLPARARLGDGLCPPRLARMHFCGQSCMCR